MRVQCTMEISLGIAAEHCMVMLASVLIDRITGYPRYLVCPAVLPRAPGDLRIHGLGNERI
jgi:hypothetical protein